MRIGTAIMTLLIAAAVAIVLRIATILTALFTL
jgi:hypothetical protein